MPRFAITKYKPENDSSPGHAGLARGSNAVVLKVAERGDRKGCPCGCGGFPDGDKATFRMGHDAKLRGKLIRAHLTGTSVVYVNGHAEDPVPALAVAERHGWATYLKDAELRREGKNRQVLKKALGSKRLVKVGRWEYTGQVAAIYEANGSGGTEYDIEYVTKSGDVKKVRVPAEQAKEIA